MRTKARSISVLLALLLTFFLSHTPQAHAAEPATAKSAGRKYALLSEGTGKAVDLRLHTVNFDAIDAGISISI